MTSKIVVNNIEADSGINTVTFGGDISGNFVGNVNTTGVSTFSDIRVTGGTISGVTTAGITTAYVSQLAGVGAGTSIQIPSGSKLVGLTTGSVYAPGNILQVVQTVYKGTLAITTNLAGLTQISGLDCTITPTSSTSQILINLVLHVGINYYQCRGVFSRNGTEISGAKGTVQGSRPGAAFNMIRYGGTGAASNYDIDIISSQYLDSPSSTSALTYSVSIGGYSDTYGLYVNRNKIFQDTSSTYDAIPVSTMTLFEISA